MINAGSHYYFLQGSWFLSVNQKACGLLEWSRIPKGYGSFGLQWGSQPLATTCYWFMNLPPPTHTHTNDSLCCWVPFKNLENSQAAWELCIEFKVLDKLNSLVDILWTHTSFTDDSFFLTLKANFFFGMYSSRFSLISCCNAFKLSCDTW